MRRLIAAAVAVASVSLVLTPATAQTTDQRFVSILFGRTQWAQAENCVKMTNTVDLGAVSQALRSRGLNATGNIVLNQVPATGFWCEGGFSLHPGWDRIQTLRQQGWNFVSAGRSYINMSTATFQQAYNNSCGSLPVFAQRGIDASGLYAYPNDKYTTAVQTNPVSTCFAWGRTYGTGVNTRSQMGAPWFQSTHTTQGARCNMPNAGCPYAAQEKWAYTLPSSIIATIRGLQPGQWYSVQFYRFVTGANLDALDRFRWDCRATDPRLHWATRPEVYCWNDFVAVMDALAAERSAGRVVVTDPKSVAAAWGRA
jgi:hypothetical protein